MRDNLKDIQIKSIQTGAHSTQMRLPAVSGRAKIPKTKKRSCLSRASFLFLILIIAFIAGAFSNIAMDRFILPRLSTIPALEKISFLQTDQPVVIEKSEKITVTEESGIIQAVKKISPAVVSIVSERDFRGFFGNIYQQKTGGTGFIITNDGLIATNKHVVADQQAAYTVVTQEGENYEAKVIARDPSNDFAIIKIEAENLPIVDLGNSNDLEVGQRVIAIGNTLGEYQNTVTAGVVSGISRSIKAGNGWFQTESLEDVIQTDAAINPGNSGGPLINLNGQVIGINTAIDQKGQLIGFAIPIDNIKAVIESVIREGKIIRPFIGIRYIPITKEFASLNQLTADKGVLIYTGDPDLLPIVPGSPAQKAGLKELDIITKINQDEINENHSLVGLLQKYKPNDEVILTVLRNKKTLEIKITLGEMKE